VDDPTDLPTIEYASPSEKRRATDWSVVVVWTVIGMLGTLGALAYLAEMIAWFR
jgi:hypothetical protein